MQNDDLLDFLQEMQDIRPIKAPNTVALKATQHELPKKLKRAALEADLACDENGLSVDKVTPVDPYDFITYKQDGVQEGVYKNLRLGKYQIDSTLNMTHLTFEQARSDILSTITSCHKRGVRTLLIQHGIGLKSKPFPAKMKSYVNQWLRQIDMVIAFHTALKQHGGLGATYVLLKKHPNQKLINRERHQKRG